MIALTIDILSFPFSVINGGIQSRNKGMATNVNEETEYVDEWCQELILIIRCSEENRNSLIFLSLHADLRPLSLSLLLCITGK